MLQDPNNTLFSYTSGFNRPFSQQIYTEPRETLLLTDPLYWDTHFDVRASNGDVTCLPDDAEPSFFPSSTDYEMFSHPDNVQTPFIPEPRHITPSIPNFRAVSTSAKSKSRSSPEDSKSKPVSSTESSIRVEKRTANTLAARRYRQKRLDQVAELETTLEKVRGERDEYKELVLKLKGETELLKDLLRQKS